MDRKDVYELIDLERDYQDKLGSDRTDGRIHNVAEEILLMESYLNRAREAWVNNAGDEHALAGIIKVVAIGVRAWERNQA